MTSERLHDVLANIRYRLRHEAISDGFVEWLEDTLVLLRSRYLRSREGFQSEDILFLKHLADVTPKLSQYFAFERQVAVVKRGPWLIQELTNLTQQIDQTHEESFSLYPNSTWRYNSNFSICSGFPTLRSRGTRRKRRAPHLERWTRM